jgi:hypothetical protein
MSCINSGVCATNNFGMSWDNTSGQVSGYAWSDNVGWVSANPADLAGCPSAPCTATVSAGGMSGWLRVISGSTAQSGGWDGFISLNGSGYGVTKSGTNYGGFAWGDINVGWVDMTLVRDGCATADTYICTGAGNNTITHSVTNSSCNTTQTDITTCSAPLICSPGSSTCVEPPVSFVTALKAVPSIVKSGDTTTLYWDVNNAQPNSCTVSGSDGETFSGASSGPSGVKTSPITQSTTFTLTCTGLNNVKYSQTVKVSLLPTFREI